VGPDYAPPSPAKLAVPQSYSTPAVAGTVGDGQRWWTSFNDPQLTAIIDLALKQNLDIDQAVARLRQARESLVQSLRARRAEIRNRWNDLLHVERALSPLAHPDTLV